MPSDSGSDLADRIDRIESRLAIMELAARYAIAVDSRDIDSWTALFVEDVNCGKQGKGREALRSSIEPMLRTFYRSVHQLCGHVIDFDGPDHATGTVYCRAEHEVSGQWIVVPLCYFDSYERREGRWYFVRRKERHWYATDLLDRPGGDNLDQWENAGAARLPGTFPTWQDFWDRAGDEAVASVTDRPVPPAGM